MWSRIIAVGAALSAVLALAAADYRALVQDYVSALSRLTTGALAISVQDVYARAERLGGLLSSGTVMESMGKSEFEALRAQLPGFTLNRDEVLIAEPDPAYFLDLARRYGGPADRAFFEVVTHIRPDGVWPVYIDQQTDYSGCTRFGQRALVDSYRRWRQFRHDYAGAYAQFVAKGLLDIEDQVAHSTCACGNEEETARELDEFAAAFPDSRAYAAALSRSQAIHHDRSAIRFKCVSG